MGCLCFLVLQVVFDSTVIKSCSYFSVSMFQSLELTLGHCCNLLCDQVAARRLRVLLEGGPYFLNYVCQCGLQWLTLTFCSRSFLCCIVRLLDQVAAPSACVCCLKGSLCSTMLQA